MKDDFDTTEAVRVTVNGPDGSTAIYLVDPVLKDGRVIWYTVEKAEGEGGAVPCSWRRGVPSLSIVIGENFRVSRIDLGVVISVESAELDFCG